MSLKVGDVIWVDEAWEDQAGHYHGEKARILEIDDTGEMKLDFFEASPEVREWLAGTDGYMVDDYEPLKKRTMCIKCRGTGHINQPTLRQDCDVSVCPICRGEGFF